MDFSNTTPEMQAPQPTQFDRPKVGRVHGPISISSLPPELLARILRFTQQFCIRVSRRPLRWVKQATHVCSFWRNVAISDPYLWTYLSRLQQPGRTVKKVYDIFLQRSKPLGVTLEITMNSGFIISGCPFSYTEIADFLSNNASRIEGLVLYSATPFTFTQFWLRVPTPLHLPSLKRVEFVTWTSTLIGNSIEPEELCPAYHIRRLAGSLDLVQDLVLPCPPRWESTALKNLVSLTVHNRGSFDRPIRNTFISALKQMGPTLEHLLLTDAVLPSAAVHPLGHDPPVHLRRLQNLHVSDDILELTDFLRCIAFPDTTHINLVCKSKSMEELSGTIMGVQSRIFRIERPWIRSMQIILSRMGLTRSITFEAWSYITRNSEYIKHLTVPDHAASLSLKLVWEGCSPAPSSEIRDVMQEVIGTLPSENLEFLALNSKVEIAGNTLIPSVLVEVFGKLPHLYSMFVKGIFLEPCIYALMPEVDDSKTMGENCVPFPTLRHLYLEDDIVYHDNGALSQKVPRYYPITLVETLAENLDRRLGQGAGIESLILKNCFFLVEEDVEFLRDIVDVAHICTDSGFLKVN